ncbi:hypothetical protein V8D89_012146, partial [Ganoderma adspersum]
SPMSLRSSVESPAGQASAPVAGPSPIIYGPEIMFDSADEWDDDEFDEIEAYDAKKGKERAFNIQNRAANKRVHARLLAKCACRGPHHDHPRPHWLPPRVPTVPLNPAMDPPKVHGGVREARMSIWPDPTAVGSADWSDYVLLDNAQYTDLLYSARAFDSGAARRVHDLLHQYDEHPELSALGYLRKLKQVWRDPHRDRDNRPQLLPLPSSRY